MHLDRQRFKSRIDRQQHGFLRDTDVQTLAADDACRLDQLLVRCGSCRFICAAQDVPHIIAALESSGDYVRDVSYPSEYGQ